MSAGGISFGVLFAVSGASAETLLIPATPVTYSAQGPIAVEPVNCAAVSNPLKCGDLGGGGPLAGMEDSFLKRWVFAEATITITCPYGVTPEAKLVSLDASGNPLNGTGIPIVDNYITAGAPISDYSNDKANVCSGGYAGYDATLIGGTSCFSSGSESFLGQPIENGFTQPTVPIDLVARGIVKPGVNELTVRLWDSGTAYGNTAIYLDSNCEQQANVPVNVPSAEVEAEVKVPPGHMPPPGQCRIWLPGTPPGHQPPAGACAQLQNQVPAGGFLLHADRYRGH
jgi:hypothetical protein